MLSKKRTRTCISLVKVTIEIIDSKVETELFLIDDKDRIIFWVLGFYKDTKVWVYFEFEIGK